MEQQRKSTPAAVLAALGKAVCYLLLFLLCQTLVSAAYVIAAAIYTLLQGGAVDAAVLTARLMEAVLTYTGEITLFSDGLVLAVLAVFFLLRKKNPLRECSAVAVPPRQVAAAGAVTPLLYAVVITVLSLLPASWLASYGEASAALNQTGVVVAIATVLIAPIMEEVVFRGVILSRLRRAMPGWLSALISAALFGLCHGQAVWIGYAFVLGLVFAFFTLRTGSILPSMLAHILFNGIGQLSIPLAETALTDGQFLGLLAAIGVIACLLCRKGLAELLRPNQGKEPHYE